MKTYLAIGFYEQPADGETSAFFPSTCHRHIVAEETDWDVLMIAEMELTFQDLVPFKILIIDCLDVSDHHADDTTTYKRPYVIAEFIPRTSHLNPGESPDG